MYVYLYMYTRVYIFPFLLDIYNFMWGDPFLLKVEQFPHQLVLLSTAATVYIPVVKKSPPINTSNDRRMTDVPLLLFMPLAITQYL